MCETLDKLLIFHPPPHRLASAHTRSCSLCQLPLPAPSPYLSCLPQTRLRPLRSASAALDLSTDIKAQLARHRKVTRTRRGQGEVAVVPWGALLLLSQRTRVNVTRTGGRGTGEGGVQLTHMQLGGFQLLVFALLNSYF